MLNIQQILNEFVQNPFWKVTDLKSPNQNSLKNFILNYNLPEDYIKFLTLTDGLIFFCAGDFCMNDISWIQQLKNNKKYNPGFKKEILNIAYFMEYELLINQNESNTSSYLYAGFASSPDDYVSVGTITDFLNGFIQAKGEIPFWKIKGKERYNFMND